VNPLLKRLANKQQHGRKSEKRVAKLMGARLTPGSGAIDGAKGDAVLPNFLVEMKATVNGSYSLKKETLNKITQEAMARNKVPLLMVSFVIGSGTKLHNGDWACLPLWFLKQQGLIE